MANTRSLRLVTLMAGVLLTLAIAPAHAFLGPRQDSEVTQVWDRSNGASEATIDHSLWQQLLDEYVVDDHVSGVNLFDYQGLLDDQSTTLNDYVAYLESKDPRDYNAREQFAYWVNLYNALTVKVVVHEYPVESIKQVGGSFLPLGPWNDEVVVIAGKPLSLNDIEHSILRPIWKDHRIHFAVNCASIGCPNLQKTAFTADNLESLLDLSAKEYLSHSRGLEFAEGELFLSSIFSWYGSDFGADQQEIFARLSRYLEKSDAQRLIDFRGSVSYRYDWRLNDFDPSR